MDNSKPKHFLARSLTTIFLGISVLCAAQSRTSQLHGTVAGPDKVLAGAEVRLFRGNRHELLSQTLTGADGRFAFVGLPWGSYSLEITLAGWQHAYIPNVELRSQSNLEIRVSLNELATTELPPGFRIVDGDLWWGTQFSDLNIEKLPNTRNIWSLLQSQEPSTVTNRLDVGGLETGVPALFGALGASWTENQYRLNGLDVTDPYQTGLPLTNPDIDALAEFQTLTGAKPAMSQGSGVTVALGTPQPSSDFHGAIRFFYSARELQSNNVNARLTQFDFPGPERMNALGDGSAQLGGKLPTQAGSFPFFVSVSTQRLSKDLGGFPSPIDGDVYRELVDFSPFSRGSQRLDLLYSGQQISNSHEGALPTTAPSATTRGNDNFYQFQALWSKTLSSRTLINAALGAVNAITASNLQPDVTGISTIDLPQAILTGPAPLALSGLRTRYEAQAGLQTIAHRPAGSHNLSLGWDWSRSDITNRWYSNGMEQILVQGAASEVIQWNTPTVAREHVQNVAEYVQDSWQPARWLTIPVGLRVDTSTGQAAGAPGGISWTTLQPRAGFIAPLGPWGLRLLGSWARYGHVLQGSYLDFGNPNALGGEIFRWQDLNGDGIAEPQELGQLLRVFGGPHSALARGLDRPFTDEITVGLEQSFGFGWSVRARFFRRDDYHLLYVNNVGVPFSDYTPVSYPDPGSNQILTLYNENPSALGHDFLVLSNSPYHSSYKGFELRVLKRLRHSWEVSASFTASHAVATTSPGNSPFANDTGFVGTLAIDPNTLINAQGRTYFDRGFTGKVTAYYSAPRGFRLGAVISYYDGVPFGRLLFVTGFNQGPFFVRATPVGHPGGFQTELNSTFDVRLARDFRLKTGILSGYVDVFNLLNANSNTSETALTGPAFVARVPLAVEAPRTGRLGLAWTF